MSKLADLVRHSTRSAPTPMGFGTRKATAAASMLLVAIASDHWQRAAAEAEGADLVLLTGRPSERDITDAVAAAAGKPCGLLAVDADTAPLAQLEKAGLDFVMLEPNAPAAALRNEKLGIALHLRDELSDIQLRTLEGLPVEAIYLEHDASSLTIRSLIELQRISGLARKPLLLPVHADAQQDDLMSLREAGVGLIGVDMKERNASDGLRHLRQLIDGLPRRRRQKQESEVRLPSMTGSTEEDDGGDDDD